MLVKILLGSASLSAMLAIYFSLNESLLFTFFKPLTTLLILLTPIVCLRNKGRYDRYIILGLVFCLIGDALLLQEDLFLFGLVSFLAAHIIFTLGFVSIDGFKYDLLPLLCLLSLGVGYYFFLFSHLGTLTIPVLCYFLFILLMAWQAWNLFRWKSSQKHRLILLGALLFMISDAILGWNKFYSAFEFSGLLVLSTYWSALGLITYSSAGDTNRSEQTNIVVRLISKRTSS